MSGPVEKKTKRKRTTSKLSDKLGVGSEEQYSDSEEGEVISHLLLGQLYEIRNGSKRDIWQNF